MRLGHPRATRLRVAFGCLGRVWVVRSRLGSVGLDPGHWFWAQVSLQLPVLVLVLVPVTAELVAGWLLLLVVTLDGQRRRRRR